jgi:hypothetical protein
MSKQRVILAHAPTLRTRISGMRSIIHIRLQYGRNCFHGQSVERVCSNGSTSTSAFTSSNTKARVHPIGKWAMAISWILSHVCQLKVTAHSEHGCHHRRMQSALPRHLSNMLLSSAYNCEGNSKIAQFTSPEEQKSTQMDWVDRTRNCHLPAQSDCDCSAPRFGALSLR